MIFHLSIVAENPKRVTQVLAAVMTGEAQPFPAVEDAWIAFANDSLGTAIEVYPLQTILEQGAGKSAVLFAKAEEGTYPKSVHFALKTPLSTQQILDLGKREGWRTVSCSRGGYFHVIEFWIENQFLVELITPDKQAEAIGFHNSHAWANALGKQKV